MNVSLCLFLALTICVFFSHPSQATRQQSLNYGCVVENKDTHEVIRCAQCMCVLVCVCGGVGYGTYENVRVCVEGGGVVLLTKLPFLSVCVHNYNFFK